VRPELPPQLVSHLRRGEPRPTADHLLALTEEQRIALAPALTAWVRGIDHWWQRQQELGPLLVAGAATMPTSAQAAAWLTRAHFRALTGPTGEAAREQAVRVLTERGVPWRAVLAERVATALPTRHRDVSVAQWRLAAALVATGGADIPTGDGFVLGWIADATADPHPSLRDRLRADPLLDPLLPRLFQVDGAGRWLEVGAWERQQPGFDATATGVGALAALAAQGRIPRATLLDGCLARLLRGGRPSTQRVFVRLHDLLAPEPAEIAAHTAEYLRLLPGAPAGVAGMAQRTLLRLDRVGQLSLDTILEASHAVLARPEKTLTRTQLRWLRSLLTSHPERTDDLLTAVTVACGHLALDLREIAVCLIEEFAAQASEMTRSELTSAAEVLTGEMRERVAASLGGEPAVLPRAAARLSPRPLPPPPFPPEIRSAPELAAAVARLLETGTVEDPIGYELILDAIVRQVATCPDELRICLVPVAIRYPAGTTRPAVEHDLCDRLARLVAVVTTGQPPRSRRPRRWWWPGARAGPPAAPLPYPGLAAPSRLLLARVDEIIGNLLGAPPPGLLLATPTRATGQVDAAALVDRLAAVAASGAAPWPYDLEQALLRLPRGADPASATRARGLRSRAGRRLAALLTTGATDPITTPVTAARPHSPRGSRRPAVRVTPVGPVGEVHRVLFTLDPQPQRQAPHLSMWPAVLPAHREVVAAHALAALTTTAEQGTLGDPRLLPALARCDGPAGPAVALAVAYGLAAPDVLDRTAASDALLHLLATEALEPPIIGRQIAAVSVDSQVKLSRVVAALGEAATSGAATEIWRISLAAIPGVLAPAKPPTGAADLLELATRLTPERWERQRPVPPAGLAYLAARPGSNRLIVEARRLCRALA
jgi:Family of unknown function (DUF6493)